MFNRKTKFKPRQPLAKTGSRSKVFSYYSNEAQDSSFDQTAKPKSKADLRRLSINRREHLRNLPTYVAVILIVMSAFYATTLDTKPKILIGGTNNKNSLVRGSTDYQQAIQKIFERSIFNRNKLTIDTNSVEHSIEAAFPEIDRATVTLPLLGRRPVIGLDPSQPTIVLTSNSSSYVIGQDGRAMIATKDLAGQDLGTLPILEDKSGITIEQGKAVLPKATVAFITTLINQLNPKHQAIESMTLPAIANELHVKLKNQPYYIKFNLLGDARTQAGTFLAVINKLNAEGTSPAEYVDVRLEERVYYK